MSSYSPFSGNFHLKLSEDIVDEFKRYGLNTRIGNNLFIADESTSKRNWTQQGELSKYTDKGLPREKKLDQQPTWMESKAVVAIRKNDLRQAIIGKIHIYLFISPNGARLMRQHEGARPRPNELLIFLEHNRADKRTDAVFLFKAGDIVQRLFGNKAIQSWMHTTWNIPKARLATLINPKYGPNPISANSLMAWMELALRDKNQTAKKLITHLAVGAFDELSKKIDTIVKYQKHHWDPREEKFAPPFLFYEKMKNSGQNSFRDDASTVLAAAVPGGIFIQEAQVVVGVSLDGAEALLQLAKVKLLRFDRDFSSIIQNDKVNAPGYLLDYYNATKKMYPPDQPIFRRLNPLPNFRAWKTITSDPHSRVRVASANPHVSCSHLSSNGLIAERSSQISVIVMTLLLLPLLTGSKNTEAKIQRRITQVNSFP